MQVNEIMQYLEDIERRYDINSWKINNIHVWPLIRFAIYFRLYGLLSDDGQKRSTPLYSRIILLISQLFLFLFSFFQYQSISKKHDIILLDDGTSYDKRKYYYYDKFCDPIQKRLLKLGYKILRLSIARKFFFPRFQKLHQIQPFLTLKQRFATKFFKPQYTIHLSGIDKLNSELNSKFKSYNVNIEDEVKKQFLTTYINSKYFYKILKKVHPVSIFTVCYYNTISMGMCLAARQLNIPVTDIQHGVQGKGHVGYYGWTKLPKQGYEFLPDRYACWSEQEVNTINEWARATRYKPYVLGNLYFEELISSTSENNAFSNYFHYISASAKPKHHILITLQTGFNLTSEITDILDSHNTDKIFFWIRMHPTSLDQRGDVIKALKKHNNLHYNIELATDTPLYSILPKMHGHITLNSSVVIEAAYLNIPSLILDETGKFYYSNYIQNNTAIFNENSVEGMAELLALISITKNIGELNYSLVDRKIII